MIQTGRQAHVHVLYSQQREVLLEHVVSATAVTGVCDKAKLGVPLDLWIERLLWWPCFTVECPDQLVGKQVAVSCCCHEEVGDGSVCTAGSTTDDILR